MIKFGTATLAGAFVALAFAPVGASAQASHHPHRYPHHRYHGDTVGTIGNDGSAYGYNRVSGRPFYKCEIDSDTAALSRATAVIDKTKTLIGYDARIETRRRRYSLSQ